MGSIRVIGVLLNREVLLEKGSISKGLQHCKHL